VIETRIKNSERRRYFMGILLLFAAAVLWSLSGALIKMIHVGGQGPSGVTIAFYRSLIAGLFIWPFSRGKWHTLRQRNPLDTRGVAQARQSRLAAACGSAPNQAPVNDARSKLLIRPAAIGCVLFFTVMTASFVVANTKTNAANAIILQYTSTFWVFALSPWLLRERPGARDIGFLGLAMIGIAIIFVGGSSTDLAGLLIALASGLFFALLTLMIRLMRDVDSAAITTLNCLGSAVLLFPVVLVLGEFVVSARELALLAVLGVVQFGLPYYLYSRGLAQVQAHQAALITTVEPVINPLWAYLALGEMVPRTTVTGGIVILAALVFFLRGAQKSRKQA